MIRIIAAAIGGVALGASGVALAFNSNPPMITRSYFLAPRGQSALIICMGANGAPPRTPCPASGGPRR